jgi:3-hydroxybutyryl-CoA dehydrogenase
MMLGTRYPRGPLAWAELIGLDHVLATLDALAAEQGDDRYRAAPLLRRMVAAGQRVVDR